MSRITGYVDDNGNFRERIEFNPKSDWDMRQMMRLIGDPEVTVESYDDERVVVTLPFDL